MNKITKRELARKPSRLTSIRPGESVRIEDREGGLVVSRQKRRRWSTAEIEQQIDRLGKGAPKIDTLLFRSTDWHRDLSPEEMQQPIKRKTP